MRYVVAIVLILAVAAGGWWMYAKVTGGSAPTQVQSERHPASEQVSEGSEVATASNECKKDIYKADQAASPQYTQEQLIEQVKQEKTSDGLKLLFTPGYVSDDPVLHQDPATLNMHDFIKLMVYAMENYDYVVVYNNATPQVQQEHSDPHDLWWRLGDGYAHKVLNFRILSCKGANDTYRISAQTVDIAGNAKMDIAGKSVSVYTMWVKKLNGRWWYAGEEAPPSYASAGPSEPYSKYFQSK